MLAVGGVDNVYLVDTVTGQEISRIPHRGIVYDASFSADGTTLATASQKMIQFWNISSLPSLETDDLVQVACSRLLENFSESQWAGMFGVNQPYEKLCENLP